MKVLKPAPDLEARATSEEGETCSLDVEGWDLRWLGSKAPAAHLGFGASMDKFLSASMLFPLSDAATCGILCTRLTFLEE